MGNSRTLPIALMIAFLSEFFIAGCVMRNDQVVGIIYQRVANKPEYYKLSPEARAERKTQLESCRYRGMERVYDMLRKEHAPTGFNPLTPVEAYPPPMNGQAYIPSEEDRNKQIDRNNHLRTRAQEHLAYCKGIDPAKIDAMLFELNS